MDTIEFADASGLTVETGLVFGEQGTQFLEVAIERAAGADKKRKVRVFSAVNMSALVGKDVQGVRIKSRDDLKAAGQKAKNLSGGYVFYGLNEYLQSVLNLIAGEDTPTQAHWGEAARRVSNDLIELADLCGVLYVTCDVVVEEKKDKPPKTRLSLNPGTEKIILGHLDKKIFVGVRGGERAVQDDPFAALAFRLPAPPKSDAPAVAPKRTLG